MGTVTDDSVRVCVVVFFFFVTFTLSSAESRHGLGHNWIGGLLTMMSACAWTVAPLKLPQFLVPSDRNGPWIMGLPQRIRTLLDPCHSLYDIEYADGDFSRFADGLPPCSRATRKTIIRKDWIGAA